VKIFVKNNSLAKQVIRDYNEKLLIFMLVQVAKHLWGLTDDGNLTDDSNSRSLFASSSSGALKYAMVLCKAKLRIFCSESILKDTNLL
jgi:hypothetical protein